MPNINPMRDELLRMLKIEVLITDDDEDAQTLKSYIEALHEDTRYMERLEARLAMYESEALHGSDLIDIYRDMAEDENR